jgi:hypothetical protein
MTHRRYAAYSIPRRSIASGCARVYPGRYERSWIVLGGKNGVSCAGRRVGTQHAAKKTHQAALAEAWAAVPGEKR